MVYLKRALSTAVVAVLMSTGALIATGGAASARVVCNAEGDCWHTDKAYHYGHGVKVKVYPDSWYFHQDWTNQKDRHYRDHHDDRGYYQNGVWVKF